jgi:hypothetical protein
MGPLNPVRTNDVTPDGQHFIMLAEKQRQGHFSKLSVVLHWSEELK